MPKNWVDVFHSEDRAARGLPAWGFALLMGRAAGCIRIGLATEDEAYDAAASAYVE